MAQIHESKVRLVKRLRLELQKAEQDADNLRAKNLQGQRQEKSTWSKPDCNCLDLQRIGKQKELNNMYAELQRRQDALQQEDRPAQEQEKPLKAKLTTQVQTQPLTIHSSFNATYNS